MIGENYVVQRGDPKVPILITCEHASQAVPEEFALGVDPELIESHWGWDRWAEDVMSRFAPQLGATTVSARVSRLVLDVNRGRGDDTLIRSDCGEGVPIPANAQLSPEQVEERVDRLWRPYHAAVDAELGRLVERHGKERVVFFTFHSFSPDYGSDRDFDVGVLFDAHEDLAAGVRRALTTAGLRTRLNEPYSGYRGQIYSAAVHGEAHEVSYFEIELNQGVLEDEARRAQIAKIFGQVVPAILPHLL